jgi:hypothetical protein
LQAQATAHKPKPLYDAFFDSLSHLSTADPKNVQEIAASQIELLNVYHQEALKQSRRSFSGP